MEAQPLRALTVKEAAARLSMSQSSFRRMVHNKGICHFIVNEHTIRVPEWAVDEMVRCRDWTR